MSEHVFKLPDLGEGMVEAEIVEWHVQPGEEVREGDIMAVVMTDKANVEVQAPVSGRVLRTTGQPGDLIAVGSELMAFELTRGSDTSAQAASPELPATVAGEDTDEDTDADKEEHSPPAKASLTGAPERAGPDSSPTAEQEPPAIRTPAGTRIRTSPAVRRRAKAAGVDLGNVPGSGPRGRILMRDLDRQLSSTPRPDVTAATGVGGFTETKVIGVRRLIANRLQAAKQQIPHFAYVEQVDITALESLRRRLNETHSASNLTYLPFVALALIHALRDVPQCNAHFDPERGVLKQFERVHLGVATQTPDGLKVPVVHNADTRSLWQLAAEIRRVTAAARDNSARREEMTGSTITVTSLGRLGGIASTPIINAPETAIIGLNRAVDTPVVVDGRINVRLTMNLSSSFDHRFVDGYDAASLIQAVRSYLEEPATIFIEG